MLRGSHQTYVLFCLAKQKRLALGLCIRRATVSVRKSTGQSPERMMVVRRDVKLGMAPQTSQIYNLNHSAKYRRMERGRLYDIGGGIKACLN